jgi:ParB-like chromosome segregation protein Spo0J
VSEITSIEQLTHDPKNARAHTPRNVGMLEQALNEVGAARSIVVDENGVVLAGNATMDAALQAGITRVRVVDADGETLIAVRRTGLTAEQKTKLALYDNRVAELAEWDAGVLAEIAEDVDLSSMFFPDELSTILESAGTELIDVNFKEYDESVENDVKYHTCPHCGEKFPA